VRELRTLPLVFRIVIKSAVADRMRRVLYLYLRDMNVEEIAVEMKECRTVVRQDVAYLHTWLTKYPWARQHKRKLYDFAAGCSLHRIHRLN